MNKKITWIFFFFFAPNFAYAFSNYDAEVVKVIDGDTVKLDVKIWIDLTKRINLRINGVNTPEKRGAPQCEKLLSQKATEFTTQWLSNSSFITVTEVKKGKYAGRALGNILNDKGQRLSQALIESGHGVAYHGGKRLAWCED